MDVHSVKYTVRNEPLMTVSAAANVGETDGKTAMEEWKQDGRPQSETPNVAAPRTAAAAPHLRQQMSAPMMR